MVIIRTDPNTTMALSLLDCPKCSYSLTRGATKCHNCQLVLGQKEWKQAADNQFLQTYEEYGTWQIIKTRIWLIYILRKCALKAFFKSADGYLRRLIVRAT
jgi:hypothetical protein